MYTLLIILGIIALFRFIIWIYHHHDLGFHERHHSEAFAAEWWDQAEEIDFPMVHIVEFHEWDGRRVCSQLWRPEGVEPVGIVYYVHGLHTHGSDIANVHWEKFLEKGFAIISVDHEGHGRSSGVHGYFKSIDVLVEDLHRAQLYYRVKPEFRNKPWFLLSGSLGALVGIDYSLKHGDLLRGAIYNAPLINVSEESKPSIFIEYIARLLHILIPELPLAPANKGKNTLEEIEEVLDRDPRRYHGWLRIGTGLAMQKKMDELAPKLNELSIPFLVMHGTADRATHHSGSEKLYNEASSEDKTIKLWEGAQHSLSFEPEGKNHEIFYECLDWMMDRLN